MAEESKKSALPPKDGDAPLQELSRDHLSVLLYVSFTGPELMALMRELGVSVPGYRTEKLSDSERADVLADEIRAYPKARAKIIEELRKIYEFPALDVVALSAPVAEEIAACAVEEDAMVRLLWRVIADPDAAIRKTATKPLEYLVKRFYGDPDAPRPEPKVKPKAKAAAPGDEAKLAAKVASLEKELERAREEVAREKEKLEESKAQLKAFRSEVAKSEKVSSGVRAEKEKLAAKLEKTEAALAEAKTRSGKADLDRAKKDAADARARADAWEGRSKRVMQEKEDLERELEALRRAKERPAAAAAVAPAPAAEDAPLEELPSTWALPRFTREFYESIEDWDPRIQRTAFKQAYLLAENHRHPSLRAIPLEGLPGYYRVRIASDVRLIYRRGDRGEVEILSLIDREDLDRYVRQAKTR